MSNYNNILVFAVLTGLVASLQACIDTNAASQKKANDPAASFIMPPASPDNYWYQGKAELSSYDVEQERYGEMRKAQQVNIFVTEDFSAKKQVKLDDAAAAGSDRMPVLKLNTVRRFNTGIYDYSIMQSVFSPYAGGSALKTTTSVQDWCGQVFAQYNNRGQGAWEHTLNSYFESEGDQRGQLAADYLEDEIWTLARLDPAKLKTGALKVIPSSVHLRLRHKPIQPEDATLAVNSDNSGLRVVLNYISIQRTLTIQCEPKAPWRITGWEEVVGGKTSSKGTLKGVRMSAYWGEHDNSFEHLRDSLRLR